VRSGGAKRPGSPHVRPAGSATLEQLDGLLNVGHVDQRLSGVEDRHTSLRVLSSWYKVRVAPRTHFNVRVSESTLKALEVQAGRRGEAKTNYAARLLEEAVRVQDQATSGVEEFRGLL